MNKLDYLKTAKSNRFEHLKRRYHGKVELEVTVGRLRSKKSIKKADEIEFQKQIVEQLNEKKKRSFRGGLVIEFEFRSGNLQSPHTHQLTKTYLDLLQRTHKDIKPGRCLLMKDDRQVKYLIVKNSIFRDSTKEKDAITISAYSFSNFLADLRYLHRIKYSDFENDDDNCASHIDYDDLLEETVGSPRRAPDDAGDYIREIYDLIEDKDYISEKSFNLQKGMLASFAQDALLRHERFSVSYFFDLLLGWNRIKSKYDWEKLRGAFVEANIFCLTSPMNVFLNHSPNLVFRTIHFKKFFRDKLNEFVKNYNIVLPMQNPLSVLIFFQPPQDERSRIDLDNLARHIIPQIEDSFDAGIIKTKFGYRNVISRYEVIELPRTEDSPANGQLFLVMRDGLLSPTLWRMLDSILSNFEDKLE